MSATPSPVLPSNHSASIYLEFGPTEPRDVAYQGLVLIKIRRQASRGRAPGDNEVFKTAGGWRHSESVTPGSSNYRRAQGKVSRRERVSGSSGEIAEGFRVRYHRNTNITTPDQTLSASEVILSGNRNRDNLVSEASCRLRKWEQDRPEKLARKARKARTHSA
ncbi:hypothetical protein E0Z10_g1277 [Xylaria hypoxylon]|uniref:Uncharacterized protein n=1 Tax=Xylaria hypoxylon TaxID=37992 RepID=A0A4Z0Z721_9PEZI|nr:hypothetical protein E0Z10_g1277 [Xylaria hypoxylon]